MVLAAAAGSRAGADAFAARSHELQRLLMSAGYRRHDGVSTAGIKLVSRLARGAKIRDWPDTETLADYDALIAVLRRHLGLSLNDRGDRRRGAAPAFGLVSG